MDTEAIAWAAQKLQAFGVDNTTMDNALMMDRLYAMLSVAPTPPEVDPVYQVFCEGSWDDVSKERYDRWAGKSDLSPCRILYPSPPSPADDESGGTVEELRHAVTVAQLDKLQLEEELISLKAADDELRKAAEALVAQWDSITSGLRDRIEDLRAALNKGKS